MKICIVNNGFGMGGVERVSTTLANSFNKAGDNVTIIDFSGLHNYYYNFDDNIKIVNDINKRTIRRKIITIIEKLYYRIYKKQLSVKNIYKEQLADLIKHLKKNKYDALVLCQGELTALIPYLKEVYPNLKIIAWQHNEYHIYTGKYFVKFINEYLEGVELADAVVCLTEKDAKEFKKINPKTYCIYNPSTITINEISNLSTKNIIFVGRLIIEQKGLDYLLTIAENLDPGWKINIAGDGADRVKFQKCVRKRGLENKINILGSLGTKELRALYLSGSIFISTSRWEGFGLVLTEAMAAGLPVISFDNAGPVEILKNGEYGVVVKNHDIQSFIKELKELMNNIDLRRDYQKKSLMRLKDFDIDRIIKKWYQVLKN
ncbi:hypothetical protein CHH62_09060 [Niallia circulans]|uniref:glycosyltransferase n=1 Tax=Niallia circulans TaxID=1397 RepID=UPI000BA5DE7F|nr:glycosyltransferase [Niallia circulans]PAD25995.1 hypothetical protein CHH62_09060 [Niallia circulans]